MIDAQAICEMALGCLIAAIGIVYVFMVLL
jgi:hypothetical protein